MCQFDVLLEADLSYGNQPVIQVLSTHLQSFTSSLPSATPRFPRPAPISTGSTKFYLHADADVLCRSMGLKIQDVKAALKQLEEKRLLQSAPDEDIKVILLVCGVNFGLGLREVAGRGWIGGENRDGAYIARVNHEEGVWAAAAPPFAEMEKEKYGSVSSSVGYKAAAQGCHSYACWQREACHGCYCCMRTPGKGATREEEKRKACGS